MVIACPDLSVTSCGGDLGVPGLVEGGVRKPGAGTSVSAGGARRLPRESPQIARMASTVSTAKQRAGRADRVLAGSGGAHSANAEVAGAGNSH